VKTPEWIKRETTRLEAEALHLEAEQAVLVRKLHDAKHGVRAEPAMRKKSS
jgi:hypothetical protein